MKKTNYWFADNLGYYLSIGFLLLFLLLSIAATCQDSTKVDFNTIDTVNLVNADTCYQGEITEVLTVEAVTIRMFWLNIRVKTNSLTRKGVYQLCSFNGMILRTNMAELNYFINGRRVKIVSYKLDGEIFYY